MSGSHYRIAIVGGGISGLSAAYHLQMDKRLDGRCVIHLFEVGEMLGGVLQTEELDGFRLELGPDSMLSRLPWGVELCQQVGLADDLIGTNPSQRGVYVVSRGRLQRLPEGFALMAPQRVWPIVTTPILSIAGKLRLAAELLVSRRTTEQDESLADFSRRRLGREVFERLVQPLAGGIYMGDPELLSVQATFPQFVDMEAKHRSLILAMRANTKNNVVNDSTGGPQYSLFIAPRRGMRQLIDSLVEHLDSTRVHFHYQNRVEQLHAERPHGWNLNIIDETTGQRHRESFAGIILATPAYQAAKLLADMDPHLGGLLDSIPYAGCVVVNLGFNRDAVPHPLDAFGFIVPHVEGLSVLACTFSSVKYAERAPGGKVLLRLFLGGGCFPEVLDWSDEHVLHVVRHELQQLLGIVNPPLFARITRWGHSMPQHQLGHLQRVEQINQRLDALDGLEVAGNAYRGVGIPHCIHSGQQASERLLAALTKSCILQD